MVRTTRTKLTDLQQILDDDPDALRPLVQGLVQEALEAEMATLLRAAKGERTADRRPLRLVRPRAGDAGW
jgi:transposase-like protein